MLSVEIYPRTAIVETEVMNKPFIVFECPFALSINIICTTFARPLQKNIFLTLNFYINLSYARSDRVLFIKHSLEIRVSLLFFYSNYYKQLHTVHVPYLL